MDLYVGKKVRVCEDIKSKLNSSCRTEEDLYVPTNMIENWQGKVLTIKAIRNYKTRFDVKENGYIWDTSIVEEIEEKAPFRGFTVGAKVQIRPDIKENHSSIVLDSMYKFAGAESTIRSISSLGNYNVLGWWWKDSDLILCDTTSEDTAITSEPEPTFKVGDTVIVKEREYKLGDYRFGFIDTMADEAGKQFTIRSVTKCKYGFYGKVPDDGYSYTLQEMAFTWSSGMFEKDEPIDCKGPQLEKELTKADAQSTYREPNVPTMSLTKSVLPKHNINTEPEVQLTINKNKTYKF